jgi:hypothetical protein
MRSDFLNSTKELAAKKVGYLCSCPDCRRLTIGAHSTDNSAINSGNAAHIYPASDGGPRYDASKDDNYLKSEINCLWLCSYHHTLVDKDTTDFSIGELQKWKSDAEKFANNQLYLSTIEFGEIKDKINDIEFVDKVLKRYLDSGDIHQLLSMIQLAEKSIKDIDYQQVFSYYRIVAYYYINKQLVYDEIQHFFSIENHLYKENLCVFFIENCEKEILSSMKVLIPEKYKIISQTIIDDQIVGKLIVFSQENCTDEVKLDIGIDIINKILLNYFCDRKMDFASPLVDLLTKYETSFLNDFMPRLKWSILKLADLTYRGHLKDISEQFQNQDYVWLVSIEKQMYIFDLELQLIYWKARISFNNDQTEISKLFDKIPNEIKNNPKFEFYLLAYKLTIDESSIDPAYLIKRSVEANDFALLNMYFYKLLINDSEKLYDLLLANDNLMFSNTDIFLLLYKSAKKNRKTFPLNEFIDKYSPIYGNDFVFHCILAEYYYENNNPDYVKEIVLADKFFQTANFYSAQSFELYIDVLEKTKSFDRIQILLGISRNYEQKIRLLTILISSPNESHSKSAFTALQGLYDEGNKDIAILNTLGYYNFKNNNLQRAKTLFAESFNFNKNVYAAVNLFGLKLNNGESLEPSEIAYSESSSDVKLLKLMLGYYQMKGEFEKTKNIYYILFSVFEDKDIDLLNSFFGYCMTYAEPFVDSAIVKSGCTVVINAGPENLAIAIHKELLFSKLQKTCFFGIYHYSENDKTILDIMYKKVGSTIKYSKKEYRIVSIKSTDSAIQQFVFSVLFKENKIQVISIDNENPQSALDTISKFVKQGSDYFDQIVKTFDDNPIIPLTLLSKKIGRSLICVAEFIYGRSEALVQNNLQLNRSSKYLISYDSILQLFSISMLPLAESFTNVFITSSTKAQLLADIENEIIDKKRLSKGGTLGFISDKLTYIEDTVDSTASRLIRLSQMKDFILGLNVIDYIQIPTEIDKNLSALKSLQFDLEFDIFCCCSQNRDITLLTDNQFMYQYANVLNLKTSGVTSLFCILDLDISLFGEFVNLFVSLHYSSPIPLYLFSYIVERYETAEEQSKVTIYEEVRKTLNSLYITMGTQKNYLYQKNMFSLYSEYLHYNKLKNKITEILQAFGVTYFRENHPDEYKKILGETWKRFLGE